MKPAANFLARHSSLSFVVLTLAALCLQGGRLRLVGTCLGQGPSRAPLRPPEVTNAIERGIESGLKYLARQQQRNGSFGNRCSTAMTSLAGLCFLSSGSTPTRGPYAENLQKITEHILNRCVTSYGLLAAGDWRPMYGHAFTMTYLAHIFGQEPDTRKRERIRTVLRNAVQLTVRAQSADGGWSYEPNYSQDEGTLTVTQLQGLRACRDAGIYVPRRVVDNAVRYIENSTNPDGGVRYRTSYGQEVRPGTTCAAVVALWNAGRYEDQLLKRIVGYVRRSVDPYLPSYWRNWHHAEYVLYFLAQAKHVLGGPEWPHFYRRASQMLLVEQNRDGSWAGRDARQQGFGEVYSTTIALLVLQLPYNRLPVYQR